MSERETIEKEIGNIINKLDRKFGTIPGVAERIEKIKHTNKMAEIYDLITEILDIGLNYINKKE
jgi:hypothetical protein